MSKEIKKRTSQQPVIEFLKYSTGLDISKEKIDACISVIDRAQYVKVVASRTFANNETGFIALMEWAALKCKLPIASVYVMEATGIYYERLAWFLHRKGLYVSVVLPNKAKKYMQSVGIKTKNDKVDAAGLARMAAEQKLAAWNAPAQTVVELRDFTRQRESLQASRTAFNNQLSAYRLGEFVNPLIVENLESIIAILNEQIQENEKRIKQKIKSDDAMSEKVDKILEIKGVGVITVATILAETNCFDMFTNQRQLVSYAGYDVVENQSGKHVGRTKISKKGNAHIRRILHMPALSVVSNGEPVFCNLYQRVFERTKIKMKGYVAVQRELLCLIYALWKKNEKYERDYKREHLEMQSKSSSFRMAS